MLDKLKSLWRPKKQVNRIYFRGNPYPKGHRIRKFVWDGRLDEDEQLWFDFHLETDDYYAEDDTEDIEEPNSDWKAKIVWGNYHSCTISSTKWHLGGIKIQTLNGKFDFNNLQQKELTADTLPLEADFDFDNLAFHIYLLGHDSCANHRIKFSKNANGNFDIDWSGKIALTYAGEDEFKHDFTALIQDVIFDGFYLPNNFGVEKAKEVFGRKLKDADNYQFVDLNPKSNKREYKLQLRK
jgi:hypothetical protein